MLGDEGFLIWQVWIEGCDVLLVVVCWDVGVLYGMFYLLCLLQCGMLLWGLDVWELSWVVLCVFDYWDNLDCYVECGYVGSLLWDWQMLL